MLYNTGVKLKYFTESVMNLNKRIDMCMLLDVYGNMLTKRQLGIMLEYYEKDKNLVEIGETFGISRQAVRDALVVAEKTLLDFEEKLGFIAKYKLLKNQLNEIIEHVSKAGNSEQLLQELINLSNNL